MEKREFPSCYETINQTKGPKLHRARIHVVRSAYGRVLEIGSGTGMNFPLYTLSKVHSVDAIEPNRNRLKGSQWKRKNAVVPIRTHEAIAENLPFRDNTFDSVVCTLVFCTIPNPYKALQEIQRVAKNGAVVLFLEHVKVDRPLLGFTQEFLNPLWKFIAGGCQLNRNTLTTIEQHSNLNIEEVEAFYKDILTFIRCTNLKNEIH